MAKNITLSKEHGLNPTIGVCAWCGKETGEIALLGKLPGDKEAPKYSFFDYNPCDECKQKWENAVICIEVTTTRPNDNRPPISIHDGKELYPTMKYVGITPEAAERIGILSENKRPVLMNTELFAKIFADLC